MQEAEINKLLLELDSVRLDVKNLRSKINSVDRRKEELFREKRKISSDIHSRIQNAKDSKDKRNNLTSVVRNTKMSKEEQEARLKHLDEEITKQKTEKTRLLTKIGVEDPLRLKKNIKALEFKIETEGVTFEKEKELMKVLSKMKKQYESCKAIVDIERHLDNLFKELRDLKAQTSMSTKIVQHTAKESHKYHLELIESSKDIDVLRDKEAALEEDIIKHKQEINDISVELDKKMARMDELRKVLNENNIQFKEDFEKSGRQLLKQKDEEVQEKIKLGKKLTTEDLLVLQRTMK